MRYTLQPSTVSDLALVRALSRLSPWGWDAGCFMVAMEIKKVNFLQVVNTLPSDFPGGSGVEGLFSFLGLELR